MACKTKSSDKKVEAPAAKVAASSKSKAAPAPAAKPTKKKK